MRRTRSSAANPLAKSVQSAATVQLSPRSVTATTRTARSFLSASRTMVRAESAVMMKVQVVAGAIRSGSARLGCRVDRWADLFCARRKPCRGEPACCDRRESKHEGPHAGSVSIETQEPSRDWLPPSSRSPIGR